MKGLWSQIFRHFKIDFRTFGKVIPKFTYQASKSCSQDQQDEPTDSKGTVPFWSSNYIFLPKMWSPRSLSAIGLVYESQTLSIGLYLFNFLGMFPDHISVSGHENVSSLPQFTIWPFCEGCLHDHHFFNFKTKNPTLSIPLPKTITNIQLVRVKKKRETSKNPQERNQLMNLSIPGERKIIFFTSAPGWDWISVS